MHIPKEPPCVDTKFKDLDKRIDTVSNEISLVRKDMGIDKMESKSISRLHNWMFGSLIAPNIGIILALISMLGK
ncbi:BDR-repeat family protein (plasmid) [Borrelia hermsii YBT]|uniref:BDR-repeat family protein n=1 Tax=Borrelia hermsii YBT TaxID=1313295 RepID=W5T740_BORHE|nr:hypothetical protein [Borrelia hermsii]AHH13161.1 BDR-repeat family protein [Borrelia hermsii YBT]